MSTFRLTSLVASWPHLDVRETDAQRQHLATPDRLFDSFMGGNGSSQGEAAHSHWVGWWLHIPKMLKLAEDAHIKCMSTFETDEHLRGCRAGPGIYWHAETRSSAKKTKPRSHIVGRKFREPTSPRPGKRVCRFAGGAHCFVITIFLL